MSLVMYLSSSLNNNMLQHPHNYSVNLSYPSPVHARTPSIKLSEKRLVQDSSPACSAQPLLPPRSSLDSCINSDEALRERFQDLVHGNMSAMTKLQGDSYCNVERPKVVKWLLEVTDFLNATSLDTFALALNYFDRFTSTCKLMRAAYQLAASTCLLLASRIHEPVHFDSSTLCAASGGSFKEDDFKLMIGLLQTHLDGHPDATTPSFLIRVFAHRFLSDCVVKDLIIENALDMLAHVSAEREYLLFDSATIALAVLSLASACEGCALPSLTFFYTRFPVIRKDLVALAESSMRELLGMNCIDG